MSHFHKEELTKESIKILRTPFCDDDLFFVKKFNFNIFYQDLTLQYHHFFLFLNYKLLKCNLMVSNFS
jgi:hypothetical protein